MEAVFGRSPSTGADSVPVSGISRRVINSKEILCKRDLLTTNSAIRVLRRFSVIFEKAGLVSSESSSYSTIPEL